MCENGEKTRAHRQRIRVDGAFALTSESGECEDLRMKKSICGGASVSQEKRFTQNRVGLDACWRDRHPLAKQEVGKSTPRASGDGAGETEKRGMEEAPPIANKKGMSRNNVDVDFCHPGVMEYGVGCKWIAWAKRRNATLRGAGWD